MKKLYFLVIAALLSLQAAFAGVGCTIDPNNNDFFNPRPDTLPCVVRNQAYNQVIQIKIPTSIDLQQFGAPFPFIMTVDSVVIDSITGFPNGIFYALNPPSGHMYGGDRACALLSGVTSDPVDNYPITFHGTMTLHGQAFPPYFDGDTTIDLETIQSQPQNPFNASLDVINQGDVCRPVQAGINDFNNELNASISVYPNPNNGAFELRMNAGGRVNGEVVVVDAMGRKVYSQAIDVMGLYSNNIDLGGIAKGLYTLQIRTQTGFGSKQ